MKVAPWIDVTVAVIRRVHNSTEFNSRDFEIALARPSAKTVGGSEIYQMPVASLHVGESTQEAAVRAVVETIGVEPTRMKRVTTSSHPRRNKRRFAIAVLYVAIVDTSTTAQDTRGYKCSFHNLGDVAEEERLYTFLDDHRELVYSAIGWIRQTFKKAIQNTTFAVSTRYRIVSVAKNHMVEEGLVSTLDDPPFSHDNAYFASGVLDPKSSGTSQAPVSSHLQMRPSDRKVQGVVDVDVTADAGAAVTSSHAENDPVEKGIRRNDPQRESESDQPIYSEVVKRRPSRMMEARKQRDAASVATSEATHPDASEAAVPSLPTGVDVQIPMETRFGFSDDEDDDVMLALQSIRKSTIKTAASRSDKGPSPQRRLSRELPDDEHPLHEDLQADFSNPLAANVR